MDKTDIPGTFNAVATLGPVNETNMARIWNKHKQFHPVRYSEQSNGAGTPLKRKVFVGMSGGVDSSVAAALLQERGFVVTGVHIKMWADESIPCQFKEDRRDALRVAEKLGIAFETWNLTEEYRNEVVNYMIAEYASGRTPNPDVMCNRKIKFGVFLKRALERDADFVATGHYVRLVPEVSMSNFKFQRREIEEEGEDQIAYSLHQAADLNKDQSYFLWTLTQDQLCHCMFPLGGMAKPEVRDLAKKMGLSTAEKPDSQGICFIGEIDLNAYLKRYIPEARGRIVTTGGKDIGEHDGLAFYTIGQREGLRVGGGIPYYVAKK
ncbi:MAG: tRNA 2-thiouridine(34) synthase MnmA, partial [Parcubacteria group bacterium]|nr:tRNA 2-thiouridine(34) synthase MnmA [Parcubacteria group bacterium]